MEKAVEEIYVQLLPQEHVLKRPAVYVGRTDVEKATVWIVETIKSNEDPKLIEKEIDYSPGLLKIFDEILVNATDIRQDPKKRMTTLKVTITPDKISVWNDGETIPVQMHKVAEMWVAEMVFGNLMAGSNFDDEEKRMVGGQNGLGAKLTNIYSTWFSVHCNDVKNHKAIRLTWHANMTRHDPPVLRASKGKKDWTMVEFVPDLSRFSMTEPRLTDDVMRLMEKRVVDAAGTNPGLRVVLNNVKIKLNWRTFCSLHTSNNSIPIAFFRQDQQEKENKTKIKNEKAVWEIGVALSPTRHGKQVSFVNGVSTMQGGSHVALIEDLIIGILVEHLPDGKSIKRALIRKHLWIFVNCIVENPQFSSQTKECLTMRRGDLFPCLVATNTKFKKELLHQTGIVNQIQEALEERAQKELRKQDKTTTTQKKAGRLTIPKLEDANMAGKRKHAHKCTLILTEGDSAKALAMSGLAVKGRDYFGVFPLKGKPLNASSATLGDLLKNEEFAAIKQILGLQTGRVYEDAEDEKAGLRYGRVLIFADADTDGTHIASLILNLFATFWPSLFRRHGFLHLFITPVIKATAGKVTHAFYSVPEFEKWQRQQEEKTKKWKVKYFKGLGTSTPAEGKEYFEQLEKHQIEFRWESRADDAAMKLAFGKDTDARKRWLAAYEETTFRQSNTKSVSYADFINKELILFSMASNVRGIPNVMDGLKPSQRKILFACFLRNLTQEIKVAQLAGYVSERAAYHHGEKSLCSTIVGLAQDFIGSNNFNVLLPNGQFGNRSMGSAGAASPRYIFTALHPATRDLFHPSDDALLKQCCDDGEMVEPQWYAPVLPTVLINGNQGIGTGWSTFIPCFNPDDLAAAIECLLNDQPCPVLHPWYRGFRGRIVPGAKAYHVEGIITKTSPTTVQITELPATVWTVAYRDKVLVPMLREGAISRFTEHHAEATVDFRITMTAPQMQKAEKGVKGGDGGEAKEETKAGGGLIAYFGLQKQLSLRNMIMFQAQGGLKKYQSVEEILREFFVERLALYGKRKVHLLWLMRCRLKVISNKLRFVLAVINDELRIKNVPKHEVVKQMTLAHYDPDQETEEKEERAKENEGEEKMESETAGRGGGFDYLLRIPLSALTAEQVSKLRKEKGQVEQAIKDLEEKLPAQLWRTDIAAFLKKFKASENQGQQHKQNNQTNKQRKRKRESENEKKVVGGRKQKKMNR